MNTGVNSLESHEARLGVRVRVAQSDISPQLRGMLGTIETCYGHPEYLALDVRLDDGRYELFWAHGLRKVEVEQEAGSYRTASRRALTRA
jgi:hypothetical protein